MKVLALIPARGGSKGLPGKNIRLFHGHPLIGWSIQHALDSKRVTKVLVSTDDPQIADLSLKYGAHVPFLRPLELAQDNSTSVDVAQHALSYLEKIGETFDVVLLLQPTSPIRHLQDLDGMLNLLEKNWDNASGVVTTHLMNPIPAQGLLIQNGRVNFYEGLCPLGGRQDLPKVHASFGIAWAIKTSALMEEKTFHPASLLAWPVKRVQAVDIDDESDFVSAEALISLAIRQDPMFLPGFSGGTIV